MAEYRCCWAAGEDRPAALRILQTCFPDHGWTPEEFADHLKRRDCSVLVCHGIYWDEVKGVVIYEKHKDFLDIVALAVEPHFQREGVGSHLIKQMMEKCHQLNLDRVEMLVREDNLDAQLFLKKQAFICSGIIENWFGEESGYHFARSVKTLPKNRIANYLEPTARNPYF